MNPLDTPEAYDTIMLGGLVSPGICIITDGDRAYNWDEPKEKGSSGSDVTFNGQKISNPKVKFQFFEASQIDEWEIFRKILEKPADAKEPKALDIVHPILNSLGITSVVVDSEGQLTREPGCLWTVTVAFKQRLKPTDAGDGKLKGSVAGAKGQPGTGGLGGGNSGPVNPWALPTDYYDDRETAHESAHRASDRITDAAGHPDNSGDWAYQ